MVSFYQNKKLIGQEALMVACENPSNTIFQVKRLIGRNFNDAKLRDDIKLLPYKVENFDNRPKIKVEIDGEE